MGKLFLFVFIIVVMQRLVELLIAKRNEQWMRSEGAIEAGASHYKWMVLMHAAFFVSLLAEVVIFNRPLSPVSGMLLVIFLLMQVLRVWCLSSLGKFWNTKILILPGANVQKRGPYRWIRHPNYVIVTTELIVLPLLFSAYFTAGLFFLLNIWMLSVRIPAEEKALRELTNYNEVF
ncbi:isoprenylcysteine carboxyl methyltransferase [Sporosarcina sp. P37]|uniref:isoprenylcysteine carboxyl methyltransferase family protein n=1 Tax=unclassified Sporosarcina TaxID=2647733 RepID=UPI0009BF9D6E|nr:MULTISPECIES: isoprenylcysteine carboxylmethyltransferase family protein [unclassified Sporosarcina]ARD47379.1 isoprenylcysteine carboxyl methyltransferase [Sporosarcina sp. P33]ARK23946.1 isoprenylcysteine carboxyl methyltransferase [Sporosarcina sp. P37]PID17261.1 isoprenylcysteine carboxyl methyltransferase [Sporosarcina sp. P35]